MSLLLVIRCPSCSIPQTRSSRCLQADRYTAKRLKESTATQRTFFRVRDKWGIPLLCLLTRHFPSFHLIDIAAFHHLARLHYLARLHSQFAIGFSFLLAVCHNWLILQCRVVYKAKVEFVPRRKGV